MARPKVVYFWSRIGGASRIRKNWLLALSGDSERAMPATPGQNVPQALTL